MDGRWSLPSRRDGRGGLLFFIRSTRNRAIPVPKGSTAAGWFVYCRRRGTANPATERAPPPRRGRRPRESAASLWKTCPEEGEELMSSVGAHNRWWR